MKVIIVENDRWAGNWHVAIVSPVDTKDILYLGWDGEKCPGQDGEEIETGEFEAIAFIDIPDDVFEEADGTIRREIS